MKQIATLAQDLKAISNVFETGGKSCLAPEALQDRLSIPTDQLVMPIFSRPDNFLLDETTARRAAIVAHFRQLGLNRLDLSAPGQTHRAIYDIIARSQRPLEDIVNGADLQSAKNILCGIKNRKLFSTNPYGAGNEEHQLPPAKSLYLDFAVTPQDTFVVVSAEPPKQVQTRENPSDSLSGRSRLLTLGLSKIIPNSRAHTQQRLAQAA